MEETRQPVCYYCEVSERYAANGNMRNVFNTWSSIWLAARVIALSSRTSFSSMCLNCYVAYRLSNFVVGLTNDDPATTSPVYKSSYTLCAQFNGSVAASADATVICSPSSQRFRYVIVQGSLTVPKALCLTEVYVYPRSK